jgi:hypothetical protein
MTSLVCRQPQLLISLTKNQALARLGTQTSEEPPPSACR